MTDRTVRAAVCTALTGPDAVRVQDWTSRAPGPGEVRLRLAASSANYPDLLMTRGLYQHRAEPPFVPGLEAAGTILDVGEGVEGWKPGDRAVAMVGAAGAGFAEETTVKAASLLPTPEGMSDAAAASLYVGHYTGYVGVVDRGRLQPHETLVVFGAAGGVGLGAVQIGLAMGATVIATASTEAKREMLRAEGVQHVLDPADPQLREKIKEIGGGGVDLVYDPVNGAMFDLGLRVLRPEGRLAVIGFTGAGSESDKSAIRPAPSNIVLIKEIEIVGVRAGQFGRRHPEKLLEAWKRMGAWHAEGKLNPHVSRLFPLDQAADALRALEDRGVVGKIAVTMEG